MKSFNAIDDLSCKFMSKLMNFKADSLTHEQVYSLFGAAMMELALEYLDEAERKSLTLRR